MTGRRRMLIRGRVQGVGYRAWTEREALRRGLSGWVRNRRDGAVEAVFIGQADKVAEMIAAFRKGPWSASVATVEEREPTPEEANLVRPGEHFSVLGTA